MSQPQQPQFNPYQPPAPQQPWGNTPYAGPIDPKIIKKFRSEMHGVGGFWIFIGAVAAVLAIVILINPDNDILGRLERPIVLLILGLGGMWMFVGICTCMKQMWALWIGLILSYLSLISNVIQMAMGGGAPILGIILLVLVIVGAHRCIKLAGQLTAAGVPLTAKPGDYMGYGRPPGMY